MRRSTEISNIPHPFFFPFLFLIDQDLVHYLYVFIEQYKPLYHSSSDSLNFWFRESFASCSRSLASLFLLFFLAHLTERMAVFGIVLAALVSNSYWMHHAGYHPLIWISIFIISLVLHFKFSKRLFGKKQPVEGSVFITGYVCRVFTGHNR